MSPRTNSLLADLPDHELDAMARHMQLVALQKGQVLFHAGEIPSHVYFPVGAIVSMMNDSLEGESLETYMLGKTCMVGVGTLGQPSFYRAQVRSSGLAYRMPAQALQRLRAECPRYLHNVQAATNRLLTQSMQNLVCCKRHPVEQQLIRWMLVTLDRTLQTQIQITHQELAEILGFRREAITLNLKKMTEDQALLVHRGLIEVLDRRMLEERACECYWIAQQAQAVAA
jgi:CRP-like cAMP-binding protein